MKEITVKNKVEPPYSFSSPAVHLKRKAGVYIHILAFASQLLPHCFGYT